MTSITRRTVLGALLAAPLAAVASKSKANTSVHTMVIEDSQFKPSHLTVKSDDTVVFVNRDGVSHSVESVRSMFSTGTIRSGQQRTISMKGLGEFTIRSGTDHSIRGHIKVVR